MGGVMAALMATQTAAPPAAATATLAAAQGLAQLTPDASIAAPPADWLAQLAPDRAPPPPGWWPLAPGWWILIGIAAAVALAAWWLRRRHADPARVLQRSALRELERCTAAAPDDRSLARDLEHLLRRYAVARFGRDRVGRLTGDAWLAFIAAHGAPGFADASGQAMLRAAYGGSATADRSAWLAAARAFMTWRAPRRRQKGAAA
jgi:hypothetical protein